MYVEYIGVNSLRFGGLQMRSKVKETGDNILHTMLLSWLMVLKTVWSKYQLKEGFVLTFFIFWTFGENLK